MPSAAAGISAMMTAVSTTRITAKADAIRSQMAGANSTVHAIGAACVETGIGAVKA
jgi:hypothetical protein